MTKACDQAVAAGVSSNGLPTITGRPSFSGWPGLPDLDLYYVDCVIGGPGAFVVANGIKDYAATILGKLILEIAGTMPPRRIAAAADTGRGRADRLAVRHRRAAVPANRRLLTDIWGHGILG